MIETSPEKLKKLQQFLADQCVAKTIEEAKRRSEERSLRLRQAATLDAKILHEPFTV